MDILKEIGIQIRQRRKELRYSQQTLGFLVSMDKTMISKIENGKYKSLEKIGYVLDALEMGLVCKRQIDEEIRNIESISPPPDISETIFRDYIPGDRKLDPTLLWDMDIENFDYGEGAGIIAERVLERGSMEDFYAAFDIMGGFLQFRRTVMQIRKINPLVRNFAVSTFNISTL